MKKRILTMKNLVTVLVISSSLVGCKKESTTPTNNTTSKTDTTTNNNNVSTDGKLGPNIVDVDGNTYKTVIIGAQQWMAENLKVTKFNDGTVIPNTSIDNDWFEKDTIGWCYYNNDKQYNDKHGKLYNWNVVSFVKNGDKNVCPTGWHVPNDNDWDKLGAKLGGVLAAGAKLKLTGTSDWNEPNPNATNSSLFSAYPSGVRNTTGSFEGMGNATLWWSSDEHDYLNGKALSIYSINSQFSLYPNFKRGGCSIRCIKND